jgi:pyruvate/2-oxoglutarate dehydrogenase complex dihydrolipoamide acyltransferase (E2) component
MGSVSITPIGMMGNVKGSFLHTSVHPISFGVGSIVKKPGVVGNSIEIRNFLQMTILLDHDVIDGAPMARFIQKLSKRIESGYLLDKS